MGKPNPLYQNFDLIKAAIAAKSPSLTMVTTKADYAGLLLSRGKIRPSEIKITMQNSAGDISSAHVKKFACGHTRLLTARELEASRSIVVINVCVLETIQKSSIIHIAENVNCTVFD
jgi:hypothetical protein